MKKNMGIELLRILAMLMVLGLHFINHGNVINNLEKISDLNKMLVILLEGMCIVAVNVFVLISGYNLYEKKFNKNRIINIIIKVWIINLVMSFIMLIFNLVKLDIKSLIYFIFPILTQEYWFVNSYIYLLLLMPFINKLIKNMDKKEHQQLLIILLILNSIISCITKNPVALSSGYSLTWFINLYLIGAFIKKYKINIPKMESGMIYLINSFVLLFSFLLLYKIFNIDMARKLFAYNNILVLISSISLFLLFINIKIDTKSKISKVIRFFSKASFSVYIFTENIFIRPVLWTKIVKVLKYGNSNVYVFYVVMNLIIIFIICVLFDKFLFFLPNKIKKLRGDKLC